MFAVLNGIHPLTDECTQELSTLLEIRTIAKRDHFVHADEIARDIGFVVKGLLRAYFTTPDGIEYNKTFFHENTFALGFASAIQQKPSIIQFQALEDTSMVVFSFLKFRALFERHRCLETLFRIVVEIEWIKKEERELRLAMNTAEERYDAFAKEYPGVEFRIPQYHVASHLGITPVQLSRIRSRRSTKG
ncbi:MAG: cyclic nucleotide-binding protein [Ectothiorhodospiraceae bacterium]|nr:cyclic nucleotide-binding protein [Ectothiorhodospiraceae bacterium]